MSTIDIDQPRRPTGQWDRKMNTPPEGTLAESATGSFLYPPRFATAEEHIAFFEAEPISDRVLSNASYSYQRWRKDKMLEYVMAKNVAASNDPDGLFQTMSKKFGTKGLEDARALKLPEWRAEAEATYPVAELPYTQLRTILRSYQMCILRGALPEEERQAVLDHEVSFNDQPWRAVDLSDHYAAAQWAPRALTESDYAQTEALNRVAGLLAQQQGIEDYEAWN